MTVIPLTGGNWHTDPFSGRPCFTLGAQLAVGAYKLQSSTDGTNWSDIATINATAPTVWSTTVSLANNSAALRIVQ